MKRTSQIITVERLIKLLGIDDYEAPDSGEAYGLAYDEALAEDGATPDDAERAAVKAETAELDEHYRTWRGALESVASEYFGDHGLSLDFRDCNGTVRIDPIASWHNAAAKIAMTIDGVGFCYVNVEEWSKIECQTIRELVLRHMHWIHFHGEVYGHASPQMALYRRMR